MRKRALLVLVNSSSAWHNVPSLQLYFRLSFLRLLHSGMLCYKWKGSWLIYQPQKVQRAGLDVKYLIISHRSLQDNIVSTWFFPETCYFHCFPFRLRHTHKPAHPPLCALSFLSPPYLIIWKWRSQKLSYYAYIQILFSCYLLHVLGMRKLAVDIYMSK